MRADNRSGRELTLSIIDILRHVCFGCDGLEQYESILKAAKVFKVPETTIRERLTGIKPRSETRTNGYKLTEIEEKSLVKQLLDADK